LEFIWNLEFVIWDLEFGIYLGFVLLSLFTPPTGGWDLSFVIWDFFFLLIFEIKNL
jgi:hypothetical protein